MSCSDIHKAQRNKADSVQYRIYPNVTPLSHHFSMWIHPLCSQILYDKCLQFGRRIHTKFIKDTKHIVKQLTHTRFLSLDHHILRILCIISTQIQGRACKLDVRFNTPSSLRHVRSHHMANNGPPKNTPPISTYSFM